MYVAELAVDMEGSSSHIIMRCVVSCSTLQNKPSTLTVYKANTSSNRATVDHMGKVNQGRSGLETRYDVVIWGLWESYTEAIIDVRLGHPGCYYHKKKPMVTILDWWGK